MLYYCISHSDSPLSLSYKKEQSIIAAKLNKPTTINISMIAYPEDVTFHWSFGGMTKTWEPINETSVEYNITNIGLTSYLTITSFKPHHQEGFYLVYGQNSVLNRRNYEFLVQPHGKTPKEKTFVTKYGCFI